MRVAVFVNEKGIDTETMEKIRYRLVSENMEPVFCRLSGKCSDEKFDLILTFGGDGTVLRAAAIAVQQDIPVLTFKAGRVGFLTAFELNQFDEALQLLNSDKLVADSRRLLHMEMSSETKYALNDCVIERDGPSRTIGLEISISGFSSYHVIGDGIIVATASGSTAYAMAAGGVISDPLLNAYQIVPISPHNPYVGPLVVSGSRETTIRVVSDRGTPLSVYADGIIIGKLINDDRIKLGTSDNFVTLLRPAELDLVGVLKTKLAFGGRLRNGI